MINFTRAFDSAWERTLVILFRPFDLGKWLTIGFSAFLAGFLQGGNGFNSSFNTNGFNKTNASQMPNFSMHGFNSGVSQAFSGLQMGMIVFIGVVVFVLVMVFIVLLYWLGARGQFLFLDNIVRNRGAIAWPWKYYARQGNSLFVLYLIFFGIVLAVILPILIVGVVMAIPLFQHHRWPQGGEIAGFVVLGFIYLAICIVIGSILFIFREFGVPLMFRHGWMAWEAFRESMNLFKRHFGSVAIFILLRIALAIALAIAGIIVCCFTCCIGALPYIGTVLLLPALVYVRCFTLDCLAQFGPEYDVWIVDVPPSGSEALPAATPPLPPG
jgi:hypothetical protein